MIGLEAREDTFADRMRAYFGEMLPFPQHVALALLLYVHIAVFARRAHELPASVMSIHGAIATVSLFALMVILRLMDELKDEDIDRRLFPDRPLPSGRVLRTDISLALLGIALLYLVINLWTGWAYFVAVFVLGYTFLMFRRFFAPEALRRSLPLTLVTHNPVVPLMVLYGFAVFAAGHGLSPGEMRWDRIAPFVVMTWSPFLAWEIARKIRCEEEEDEYVTYSRLLGRRRAVLVTWLVQGVGTGAAILLWSRLSLPGIGLAVILSGLAVNVWAGIRFIRDPRPQTSRLKPFATAFVVAVLTSQVFGATVTGGAG